MTNSLAATKQFLHRCIRIDCRVRQILVNDRWGCSVLLNRRLKHLKLTLILFCSATIIPVCANAEFDRYDKAGTEAYEHGKYAEAETLFSKGLKAAGQSGLDQLEVATAQNNLAEVYRAQAKYSKAEPLYKNSLTIREQALGPNHPTVATSLNNLALLYVTQGRYAQAESLFKRSLTIVEKTLGPNHLDVLKSL
ncbi:MAG: hypothetical protein C0508_25715, partial [Cyanobacteria bacterium PR.023]|nr:hypothetical protein [Cyanobacteria bacterium PR.023]